MRAIKFVSRHGQKIAIKRADVRQLVRNEVHGVKKDLRIHAASQRNRARHVVNRTERIRGGADRNESGATRHRFLKIFPVDLSGLRNHARVAHGNTSLERQSLPRINVGVMIQFGDHDFIRWSPIFTKGTCQVERERCHIRAEGYL